jgi:hypothetical protein
MVQEKPIVFAELLVPILLDLILLESPRQQTKSPKGDIAATNAPRQLEPVHWLNLLQHTLEQAPPHVVDMVSQAFVKSTSKLLPCNNASWYSTQDLAYDYNMTMNGSDSSSPEYFLLAHGLADLSEQLSTDMITMAYGGDDDGDRDNDENYNGEIGTFAASSMSINK